MVVSYDLTPEEQEAVEAMLTRRRTSIAKGKAKNFLFEQYEDDIVHFIVQNCNDTKALATLILENNTRESLINFILNSPDKFYNKDEVNQFEFFDTLPLFF